MYLPMEYLERKLSTDLGNLPLKFPFSVILSGRKNSYIIVISESATNSSYEIRQFDLSNDAELDKDSILPKENVSVIKKSDLLFNDLIFRKGISPLKLSTSNIGKNFNDVTYDYLLLNFYNNIKNNEKKFVWLKVKFLNVMKNSSIDESSPVRAASWLFWRKLFIDINKKNRIAPELVFATYFKIWKNRNKKHK